MSSTVGAVSSTTNDVPYNSHLEEQEDDAPNSISDDAEETEPEDDDDDKELDLGPQFTLKEQLEKDKDDESLRKWKEQLLGSVDISAFGESKDPEVKIQSLTITTCSESPDLVLPIPFTNDPKKSLFILKEGSQCRMKFTFTVSNNIVSGLKYTNIVSKTGVRVNSRKKMLGTFSPQHEPYTYELEEKTTPSGIFARGTYAARTKFVDDDKKCYLDVSYYFEIQRNWGTPN